MSDLLTIRVEPWQRDVIIEQVEDSIQRLVNQLSNMEALHAKLVNGDEPVDPSEDPPAGTPPKKRGRPPKAKTDSPPPPDDPGEEDDDLMDAIEVADFLGTGAGNVHVLRGKKMLPDCQRVGKKNMWKREEIEQFQKTWTAGRGKKKL